VLTQKYDVTVSDGHGGSAIQTVTVTITGTNDAPTIAGAFTTATGSVTEEIDLAATENAITHNATGTIAFADVDTLDTHTAGFAPQAGGYLGSFSLGAVNQAGDTVDWSFEVDDSVLDHLAAGETLTQKYDVIVGDGHGGAAVQTVTVTITGTDDAPTIVGASTTASGSVTEEINLAATENAITHNATGTIAFADVDTLDTHSAGFAPQAGGYLGSFSLGAVNQAGDTVGWSFQVADSAIDFLAAGQVLTQKYDVTVDDGHGGSVVQTVTVTITGTNDAPVVEATDVTGAVTELGTPAGNLTDSGTIAFTDVDLADVHSIGVVTSSGIVLGTLTAVVQTDTTGSGTGGVIKWDYSVPASAVEYLAAGETRVETFTFALSDGHGGTVDQTVSVTITGTNDDPDITVVAGDSAAANLVETDSGLSTSGTLTVTDVDLTNTVTPSVLSVAASGDTAGLVLTNTVLKNFLSVSPPSIGADPGSTHNLNWAFNSGTEAFDYLAAGQSLILTYTVRASDGTASDDQIVTITISGTNDDATPPNAPVIVSVTDNVAPLTGTFTTSGVATNDTDLTVKVTLPTTGSLAVAGDTVQLYNGTGTGNLLVAHVLTPADISAGFVNLQTGTLTNGTTYNLTARITDAASNQSAASNTFTVIEDTTADAGGDLAATKVSRSGNNLTYAVTGLDADATATVTFSGTNPSGNPTSFTQTVSANGNVGVSLSGFKNGTNVIISIVADDPAGNHATGTGFTEVRPAGVSGEEINLALHDPTADASDLITFKVTGVPAGWTLNAGTLNADGSWTVSTTDPSALTVKSPSDYTGAVVLNVAASWTNADGSSGSMFIYDNVEVFAQGAPIFALSAEDHLTGSSGSDLFVFGQPISGDTLHNFDAVADKIDLIGFDGIGGFGDLAIADDGQGNAVVTLGANQTITILGVAAASLGADNFVFNVEPVMDNAGTMTIADGAIMPLGGTINNTGTIALGAADAGTELEVIVNGVILQGGGHLTLSDDDNNLIFGGASDALLSNIDNIVSGAGQIGGGQMTLANAGTILADGAHALVIDTGANTVTNAGLLESTGSGGLIVSGNLANDGHIWANGGDVTIHGDVTGSGDATISGTARLDLDAGSHLDVLFADDNAQTLELDAADLFSGTVTGFGAGDVLDFADLGLGTTLEFAANADGTGGTLTLTDGAHAVAVNLAGTYQAGGFTASCQQGAGVLVTYDEAHIA
jgi:VCBS repeat-containing protein